MNLKTLTGQVEYILSTNIESRNSDITLTVELWRHFYPKSVHHKNEYDLGTYSIIDDFVFLRDLYNLPHQDNIKRIRAAFQNDALKYLPTDQKIAQARGINEVEWREHLDDVRTLHRV